MFKISHAFATKTRTV
jgi:2-oxoisovalerate dehydrogenase E1 component beta subunit